MINAFTNGNFPSSHTALGSVSAPLCKPGYQNQGAIDQHERTSYKTSRESPLDTPHRKLKLKFRSVDNGQFVAAQSLGLRLAQFD